MLVLLVLACLLGGCSGEEAVSVDFSLREDTAQTGSGPEDPAGPGELTYAYLPQYAHTVSHARHKALVAYLGRATGRRVRQVFPDTFDAHVRMVREGLIDISFVNPFVYVSMAPGAAQAIARGVEDAERTEFRGQIVVRADNEALRTLDDCRGKRWIAVDPHSAGGYLFALGYFKEHGLTRQDFAEVAFAPGPGGKQEKVVLAVLAGAYDLGSIREGTLDVVRARTDLTNIRVLAETRAYPGWVFATRSGLDEATREAVARALTGLTPEDPENARILSAAKLADIIPARDEDYDPIRALARDLSRDPSRDPADQEQDGDAP